MFENFPNSPSISTSSLTQTGSTRGSTMKEVSQPSNDPFDFENFAEYYVPDKPLPDHYSAHASQVDYSASVSEDLESSDRNNFDAVSIIFDISKPNSPTNKMPSDIKFLSQERRKSIPLIAPIQDYDQANIADISQDSSTTTSKIPSMIAPHVKVESPKAKLFFDARDFSDVVAIVDSNLEHEENHKKKLVRNTHPRSISSNTSNTGNNQTTENSTKTFHLFNTFNMPKRPDTLSSEILMAPDSAATDEPPTQAADKQKVRKSDRFLGKFPTREEYEIFHKHQTIHPKLCEPVRYRVIIGAGVEALFEFDSRYPAGRLEEFAFHRVTGYLEITKGQWEHLIKQWDWNMEEDYGEDEHGEPIIIDFDDKKETKRVINENRKLT